MFKSNKTDFKILPQVLKFIVCMFVIFFQSGRSFKVLFDEMYLHLWKSPGEVAKVSVPSFLYVIQNNLLYLALSNLDAATYQVCYQLKILTTAVFSAVMLKVCSVTFKKYNSIS